MYLVGLPTEPILTIGCYDNDECPLFNACENKKCINPCAERNPCAPTATCKVINHEPECTCPDGFIDTSSSGEKFPDFDVKCIMHKGNQYGKPDFCLESGAEKIYFTDRKTPNGESDHQKNKGFALGLLHAINEGGTYI